MKKMNLHTNCETKSFSNLSEKEMLMVKGGAKTQPNVPDPIR